MKLRYQSHTAVKEQSGNSGLQVQASHISHVLLISVVSLLSVPHFFVGKGHPDLFTIVSLKCWSIMHLNEAGKNGGSRYTSFAVSHLI